MLGYPDRPTIEVPRTSCTPNKPQYDSHPFFRSNANLPHPILAVCALPDELILCILSHISPDPRPPSHYTWFYSIQYNQKGGDGYLQQRVGFLRLLSMTCKEMWFRLLPWVWERLELPLPCGSRDLEGVFVRRLNATVDVLHMNPFPATIVKYFYSTPFHTLSPELIRVL